MKPRTYWRGDYWICTNHLPSVRLPASLETCWYSNCKSTRPPGYVPTTQPKLTIVSAKELCEWEGCKQNNGKRAFKLEGRKYCSHKCRKDKARWAYRERKKLEKKSA